MAARGTRASRPSRPIHAIWARREQIDRVVALRRRGREDAGWPMTWTEIAAEVGTSRSTAIRYYNAGMDRGSPRPATRAPDSEIVRRDRELATLSDRYERYKRTNPAAAIGMLVKMIEASRLGVPGLSATRKRDASSWHAAAGRSPLFRGEP